MTLAEAETIVGIMETADGGCSHCASALIELLAEAFPQFVFARDEQTFDWVVTERSDDLSA